MPHWSKDPTIFTMQKKIHTDMMGKDPKTLPKDVSVLDQYPHMSNEELVKRRGDAKEWILLNPEHAKVAEGKKRLSAIELELKKRK